jgi:polar amino acid transport system substrate-binding protein
MQWYLALPRIGAFAVSTLLASCSLSPMSITPSPAVVTELAPAGKLRAVINLGNPVLAGRDGVTGDPRGVSVDLSRELARRLGVPLELSTVDTAAQAVEALKSRTCDVGFVAIDPVRGADLEYTAAYVQIEGAYLVPEGSPIRHNAEVDREGVQVVAGAGSAYDLYLTRELKHAQIVRASRSSAVVDTMLAERKDVAAGVKQQLEADAKRVGGVRLLEGRFMVINQAMALPKGRTAAARYLAAFVEEMKASGFVAAALARHAIAGATVAPAAKPGGQVD